MKVLSASEAIWPALQRTYYYLFRPFRWETFLKLAAAATVSEGILVSLRFGIPSASLPDIDTERLKALLFSSEFMPITVLACVAALVVALLCYYWVIHLRFAFFHCLVHQAKSMRPAWKLYRAEVDRFFTASVLVGLGFFCLLVLTVAGFGVAAFVLFTMKTPDGKLDPGNFLILFIPCTAAAALVFFLVWVARIVMHDFVLPHMALEGLPFGQAWSAVRARIGGNKETFLSYFILRALFLLVVGTILVIVAWLLGWAVFAVLGKSAAGFDAMLDDSTRFGAVFGPVFAVLFVLLNLVVGFVLAAGLGGPLAVFLRSYALFYYGGHYRALGEALRSTLTPQELEVEASTSNIS